MWMPLHLGYRYSELRCHPGGFFSSLSMKFLFLSILEVGRGGALEKTQLRILKEDSTMCIVLGTSSVFTAFWIILFLYTGHLPYSNTLAGVGGSLAGYSWCPGYEVKAPRSFW